MREEIEVRDNLLEMLRLEAIEASQTLKTATQVMFKDSGARSSCSNRGIFVKFIMKHLLSNCYWGWIERWLTQV